MNAVLHPKYEVFMLTIEAIEVHLASLHKGQDHLREDVQVLQAGQEFLRQRVEAVNESLREEIGVVKESLTKEIGSVRDSLTQETGSIRETLTKEIGAVHTRIDSLDKNLSGDLAELRGMQKAMLWVMSGLGSLGFIGKILHWF